MRVIVSILGLALAVASSLAAPTSAQTPTVADGCYTRDYAKGVDAEDYTWVRIVVRPRPDKDASSPFQAHVTVKYGYASLPTDDFAAVRVCRRDGASIVCPEECGSGTLRLRSLSTGEILAEADRLLVEETSLSTLLLLHKDARSTFEFHGAHVLRPAPAEQCSTGKTADDSGRVLFEPGDYHPKVAVINRQLAKLGFLSAPSDPLFTRDTAAAMKAFQQSMGYALTGKADVKSVRALNARALTMGSC